MSDSNSILLLSAASASHAVLRLEHYLNSRGLNPRTTEIIQWKLHPEEAAYLVFLIDEDMLQNVAVQQNLQPIFSQYVAKGNKIIPLLCASNKENSLEPALDKVSDIVHYLNYWQEQYLELRRLKRLESTNELEINQQIETVKTINQEMGELLRVCLAQQPLSLEDLQRTHWEDFFKRIKRTDLFNTQATSQPSTEVQQTAVSTSTPQAVGTKKTKLKATAAVELDDIDGDDFDLSTIDKATPTEQTPMVPSKASQMGFTPINELIDEVSKVDAAPGKKGTSNATMADALQAFAKKKGVEKPGDNNIQFIDNKAPSIEPIATSSNMEESTEKKISMQETANIAAADVALSEKLAAISQAQRQFKMQQIQEGIQTLEAAQGKYPADLHLQYQLAQALHTHTNEMERSQTLLRNILKEDPNHEDALAALADQFLKNGKYKQAAVLYDRVWKLNPEALDVVTHLALLHSQFVPTEPLHLMQIAEAAEENDGPSATVSQAKGRAQEAQGRIKEAIAAYTEAYQMDASNGTVAYDLALIHYREGNAASAKHWYEVAVAQQGIYKTPENDAAFGVSTTTSAVDSSTISSTTTETVENQGIDQTVCITGATSGIGKATAIHFAKAGYLRLVLTGRRADRLADLKASLSAEYGVSIETLTFDVRDNEASAAALAQLQGKMAQIDVLINNAGLAKGLAPIQEGSLEHWNTMIDTNIKGILHISRLVTPGMVARRSGMIINLCSTAGKEVYPMGNVYCATKHAVDALTKGMRQDLFKYGIRVGQVSPAHVEETEFALVRMDGDAERAKIYQDFQPLKSADVADAIFYMATRPAHVNVQDILLMGTQQASSTLIDRSGR